MRRRKNSKLLLVHVLLWSLLAPFSPRALLAQEQSDPAQEDDPAAAREAEQRRLASLEEDIRADFEVTDEDRNGWISFREAKKFLATRKDAFRRFDADRDGRLDAAEFTSRYLSILERVGSVRSPTLPTVETNEVEPERVVTIKYPSPRTRSGDFPNASDVLRLFDLDRSRGLSPRELRQLLVQLGVDLSADLLLRRMDTNESRQLEAPELNSIVSLVDKRLPEELRPKKDGDPWLAHVLAQTTVARDPGADSAQRAPRVPGPVSHFRRLDLYSDGWIDADDLRGLSNSIHIALRPGTLIAALDLDGDGRLSEAEFEASLGG